MTIWRRYVFQNFKTHAVPVELEVQFVCEMNRRGAELCPALSGYAMKNPATITEWGVDVGGMCNLHRPHENFTWCGLEMSIPCEDVPVFAIRLGSLQRRWFADGAEYRKLTTWQHCTVMTPDQEESLRAAIVARLASAEDRDRMFREAADRGERLGVS